MTYEQSISFLDSRIGVGWKLGLDSMKELLRELDNPQDLFQSIHVAGTNGKGTTCAMLEAIFRAAGYRTGMYTSPHLYDVRERIRISGENIKKEQFARLLTRIAPLIKKYNATYFETLTVLAVLAFAEEEIDIALIEVGLGGRLDATNVITPLLSIITSIDFDHTAHLGDTLEKIAYEKAGIIKSEVPCLVGPLSPEAYRVIRQKCNEQASALYRSVDIYKVQPLREMPGKTDVFFSGGRFAGVLSIPMNGRHQQANAGLALAAADMLSARSFQITIEHVNKAFSDFYWAGRFEIVHDSPTVLLDVAHNPASFDALLDSIHRLFKDRKLFFVIGLMQDKDVDKIVARVASCAHVVQPVAADDPRALPAHELHEKFAQYNIVLYDAKPVGEGVVFAWRQCEKNALLCIAGSHYIAGDAMEKIKGLTK